MARNPLETDFPKDIQIDAEILINFFLTSWLPSNQWNLSIAGS